MSKAVEPVLRAAALIAVITIISRIAGFIRYLVFGASVGAGEIGSAYASANLLPNLLFEIAAGGALAAMVIPLISGIALKSRSNTAGANEITSTILNWSVLICLVLSGLVFFYSSHISKLIFGSSNTSESAVELAAYFLQIFAVQIPFYAVAIVLGAFLQSQKKFLWPALAPLISSLVVMIAYLSYAATTPAVVNAETLNAASKHILGWGTTLAVIAMALSVLIPAFKHGFRYQLSLSLPSETAKQALGLGSAGFTSVFAQQLVMALILLLAAKAISAGTLPLFQYGQAVYLLPFAVLIMPLITSSLPYLSELRLVGDQRKFSLLARTSIQSILLFAAIGASTLWGAGIGIDRFFAIIDRNSIQGVGAVTAALALGLIGYSLIFHTSRLLSAALRAKEALILGSVPWVAAGILILVSDLRTQGRSPQDTSTLFALCIAAGMGVGMIAALTLLNERILTSMDMALILRTVVVSIVATVLAGGIGYFISTLLTGMMRNLLGTFAAGAISGIFSAVLCLGLIYLFDKNQAKQILFKLKRLSKRHLAKGQQPA